MYRLWSLEASKWNLQLDTFSVPRFLYDFCPLSSIPWRSVWNHHNISRLSTWGKNQSTALQVHLFCSQNNLLKSNNHSGTFDFTVNLPEFASSSVKSLHSESWKANHLRFHRKYAAAQTWLDWIRYTFVISFSFSFQSLSLDTLVSRCLSRTFPHHLYFNPAWTNSFAFTLHLGAVLLLSFRSDLVALFNVSLSCT